MLCIQQRFKVDQEFNFDDWKAGQEAVKHLTGFQIAVFDLTHVLAYYKWDKRKEDTSLVRGQRWVEL